MITLLHIFPLIITFLPVLSLSLSLLKSTSLSHCLSSCCVFLEMHLCEDIQTVEFGIVVIGLVLQECHIQHIPK